MMTSSIFPDNMIESFGLGLTYSIWFGLFGYALLKIINGLIGESKSELRYYTASSILFIVLFLTVYTIFDLSMSNNYIAANGQEYIRIRYSDSQNLSGIPAFLRFELFSQALSKLNELVIINTIPILISWLTGIALLSIRYFFALRSLKILRDSASPVCSSQIDIIIDRICSFLGISSKIEVAESRLITVPSVIGILKPIILLPAGMIINMPADQLELILAHEFAHIRRLDPWFKMMQSIIEILLFFNPFVWLISKSIDLEREKCCDDSALKVCDNRLALAKALHFIAEFNLQHSQALGFSGKSSDVLIRVGRILKPDLVKPESAAGSITGFAITTILSLVIIMMSLGTGVGNHAVKNSYSVNQANALGVVRNGDDILNILESKFGDSILLADKNFNSAQKSDKEFHSKVDGILKSSNEVRDDLVVELNKLLGDNSEFKNIMNDLEIDIPEIEKYYSKELLKNFNFSGSFNFDFDADLDLDDMKNLKDQITDLQENIKSLSNN